MAARPPLPRIEFTSIQRDINCRGFSCKSREINRWLSGKALKEHDAGYLCVTVARDPSKPARPMGVYALATVAEEVSNLPGRYHAFRSGGFFSALQLVWLATDRGFEGRGLGELMVGRVIQTFAEVGPVIGLPHLIVLPDPKDHERLTKFYGKLGFTPYKDGEAMFLSVQAAVEAVNAERARRAAEAVPVAGSIPVDGKGVG